MLFSLNKCSISALTAPIYQSVEETLLEKTLIFHLDSVLNCSVCHRSFTGLYVNNTTCLSVVNMHLCKKNILTICYLIYLPKSKIISILTRLINKCFHFKMFSSGLILGGHECLCATSQKRHLTRVFLFTVNYCLFVNGDVSIGFSGKDDNVVLEFLLINVQFLH